jgi:hypothetical protein
LKKKVLCSGLIKQACDVCLKQKKSCSNGDEYSSMVSNSKTKSNEHLSHHQEATVKEELKSPIQSAGSKCKAYSTTDSNPIGVIDSLINVDFNSGSPVRKQSKMFSGSTPGVHFDGAETPTSTRKSTHSAMKKDLSEPFKQLGEEYGMVSKTFNQIADLVD